MTICYKLTNQDSQTYNNTQWGENVTHQTNGGGELCGSGWIHVYSHPLLAVLLNPIHGNFNNPILWEVECDGETKSDHGLKLGFTKVTTVKQIALPKISKVQQVKFAILCASKVYLEPKFIQWCDNWINNVDRSTNAVAYAAHAANAVAYAAHAAAYAAHAAAYAPHAAASAAYAAAYAAYAAHAAASAAYAAAYAAYAAHAEIDDTLDLIAIAQEAMKD